MLVAPEYNASLTPLMKNALDWVSVTNKDKNGTITPYKGKIFALASASPGGLGGIRGLSHLRDVLTNMSATVIAEQVAVGNAENAFNKMDELKDERASGLLEATCKTLVNTARLLSMN